MNTILVPTDFSNYADNALDFACKLTEKIPSKILLLNVLDYSSHISGMYAMSVTNEYLINSYTELKTKSDTELKKKADILKARGISVEVKNAVGFLHEIIDEVVKEFQVSLIVMGTKGCTGFEEILIGSNVEKVVRKSTVPVISINEKVENVEINNVIFAHQFDEPVGEEFLKVINLLKLLKTKVHLLRINSPNNFLSTNNCFGQMEKFAAEWEIEDYTVQQYDHQVFESGLLEAGDMLNADLIILGTHGRKGLIHLFLGSQTEGVVNHLEIPILTFKIK